MKPLNSDEFLSFHLDHVSRSFSFCIEELTQPLKNWVRISYLLCRIADTIEDTVWHSVAQQQAAFEQLLILLDADPKPEDIRVWAAHFPQTMTSDEALLIAQAEFLFKQFHDLPCHVQEPIKNCIQKMVQGMIFFMNQKDQQGILKLKSLNETNHYCFYVAGTVGELLDQLFNRFIHNTAINQEQILQAHQFGLFLQKTNILKDKNTDEQQGRILIADEAQLIESMVINAGQAMKYLHAIPVQIGREYRIFCAWSLFLGLASFPWICDSKPIPRKITMELLSYIKKSIDNKYALERLFLEYLQVMRAHTL